MLAVAAVWVYVVVQFTSAQQFTYGTVLALIAIVPPVYASMTTRRADRIRAEEKKAEADKAEKAQQAAEEAAEAQRRADQDKVSREELERVSESWQRFGRQMQETADAMRADLETEVRARRNADARADNADAERREAIRRQGVAERLATTAQAEVRELRAQVEELTAKVAALENRPSTT